MPDTKITALTAITTVDPAADVLPIVDVSDTSMAASGTTKKITSNQILGAGGTATLASATITGDLTVRTNKLAVTSVGVGVGTSSPLMPLDVRGAAGAGAVFLRTTDPTAPVSSAYIQTPVSTGFSSTVPVYGLWYQNSGMGNPANDTLNWIIGSGEQMRLNSNGLGVGASPLFKFHVQQTLAGTAFAVNPLAYIVNNGSGNTAKLTLSDAVTTDGNITLTGSATAANRLLGFGINGVQQMVLDGNGNLGIGVQPSAFSGVKALQIGTGALYSVSSGSQAGLLSNAFYDGAWKYISTSFAARYDQPNGSHQWFTAPSGTAGNAITFTQAMTLDASGRLLVGPTSANTSGGVLQLSSGITFPATQVASSDANTLDDYEEGTFTPAITGSTTAGTATYVGRSGKYTKIGNLVQVQIFIDYNSHTGTGDTRITGLPFTNAGNFSAATVGYANGLALTAGNYVQAYVDASQSFILLNQAPTGGGSNTTVPIDPAATLVITATYTV